MLDWTTPFPYIILAAMILFCIGIYTLISSKKFLKVVFGIIFLLMAGNLLLLSFGSANNQSVIYADPLAQTLSFFILIVGVVFVIIGVGLDKRLRKVNEGSTLLDFDFSVQEGRKVEEASAQTVEEIEK